MRLVYLLLALMFWSCAASHPRPQDQRQELQPTPSPEPVLPAAARVSPDSDEDPYLAVPRVLDGLNRARAAQGVAPVRLDRALCALAQRGTAIFFQYGGHGAETRTANVLADELDRFRHVYLRVRTAVLAPPSLSAVAGALQPAMDADWAYVGIAVEQQRQETAVVLIFAQ